MAEHLDPDLADILGNYEERHANGESYEEMAKRVEDVGDKRLSALLRSLHAGEDPRSKQAPPKARAAGNKSVAATMKGKAE